MKYFSMLIVFLMCMVVAFVFIEGHASQQACKPVTAEPARVQLYPYSDD